MTGPPAPARLYQAAPSRLTAYLDCPRAYRYRYLDRPRPPAAAGWAHLSFGAAVHTALAGWWRLDLRARTAAAAGRLLDEAWLTDGYRDASQADTYRRLARSMVERYAARLDPARDPIGVERTVALTTGRSALYGRVDRIDDRADGIAVVDYKTGRQTSTADEARTSLALAVYAAGASRVFRRRVRRVELHHLPSDTVAAFDHTDESLGRHLRRADGLSDDLARLDGRYRDGLDEAVRDREFPARVGARCAWCDFNRHCPEGGAAFAPRESWAGLPAAEDPPADGAAVSDRPG